MNTELENRLKKEFELSSFTPLTEDSLIAELAARHNATIVRSEQDIETALVHFFSGGSHGIIHQFVLPMQENSMGEMTYEWLLVKVAEHLARYRPLWKLNPERLQEFKALARHENAHHYEVIAINNDEYWGQKQGLKGKAASVRVLELVRMGGETALKPYCLLKLSDFLSPDEKLYINARVSLAPYYLKDDHINPTDLSPSDIRHLQGVFEQISTLTPLTHQLYKSLIFRILLERFVATVIK